mmetsp:Transcript_50066/g.160229  ORF Transcript_50066/g.160229 Transcript_50066/m.160229 type:complete len:335 (-) Transcript_50066:950-1954(-)
MVPALELPHRLTGGARDEIRRRFLEPDELGVERLMKLEHVVDRVVVGVQLGAFLAEELPVLGVPVGERVRVGVGVRVRAGGELVVAGRPPEPGPVAPRGVRPVLAGPRALVLPAPGAVDEPLDATPHGVDLRIVPPALRPPRQKLRERGVQRHPARWRGRGQLHVALHVVALLLTELLSHPREHSLQKPQRHSAKHPPHQAALLLRCKVLLKQRQHVLLLPSEVLRQRGLRVQRELHQLCGELDGGCPPADRGANVVNELPQLLEELRLLAVAHVLRRLRLRARAHLHGGEDYTVLGRAVVDGHRAEEHELVRQDRQERAAAVRVRGVGLLAIG